MPSRSSPPPGTCRASASTAPGSSQVMSATPKPITHEGEQPGRLAAGALPPGAGPEGGEGHDQHEREPGQEGVPRAGHDVGVPDAAHRRARPAAPGGCPRGAGRRPRRRVPVAVVDVEQPGDQPGRVRRPGRTAARVPVVRRIPRGECQPLTSRVIADTSPAEALRLPSGTSTQAATGRRPVRRVRAAGEHQPRQHAVPDQDRPVPDHEPLDGERVPDGERDRGQPRGERVAHQPGRAEARPRPGSRGAPPSAGASPGRRRRGPRPPRPTVRRGAGPCRGRGSRCAGPGAGTQTMS